MEAKKKEVERVDSVCNGLKTQVESLREELKATQKAFRDKMDLSLAKLDGEWAAKMDQLKADHAVSRTRVSVGAGSCGQWVLHAAVCCTSPLTMNQEHIYAT